jgi:hypothetical protein
MGWASIVNGDLIKLAEAHFDLFITEDKGMMHQQNFSSTVLGFILLRVPSNRLEDLLPLVPDILTSVQTIKAGETIQLKH